jgi:uncharacterized DUF497 family protein
VVERQFQFEWDEAKAAANLRKHGVAFELARTVFGDPRILTIAEERWFSIGEQRRNPFDRLPLGRE